MAPTVRPARRPVYLHRALPAEPGSNERETEPAAATARTRSRLLIDIWGEPTDLPVRVLFSSTPGYGARATDAPAGDGFCDPDDVTDAIAPDPAPGPRLTVPR